MIVDLFAGAGGASTGIELALGRSPDVAAALVRAQFGVRARRTTASVEARP